MNEQPADFSSIDSYHVGRRRKPNFTDHEVLNIIDQYDRYKELLHSREASKTIIAQKQAIWKQITENLNAAYPQVERTVEDVRRKWKKLQSEAKREVAAYRAAQQGNGSTPTSSRQISFYYRILSICRAPNSLGSNTNFSTSLLTTPLNQNLRHHSMNLNNGNNSNHEQLSDKIDSPSSDLQNGQLDSPEDESASLLGNDDGSPSPMINTQPTSLSTFVNFHQSTQNMATAINGQVSKRTLDKQRKQLKSARVQQMTINNPITINTNKFNAGHSTSLRYESLNKRKRTLELTMQRLLYDKECLLLERKNLDIKLAMNENEHERVNIEKRRVELTIQKYQNETSSITNGNANHHHHHHHHHQNQSDIEDHDGNNSADEMSDINE